VNAGAFPIPNELLSIAPGADASSAFQWRLENKNYFSTLSEITEFSHVVSSNDPFVMQTRFEQGSEFSQFELTFNNVQENQNGELSADFVAIWTTNVASLTIMKTMERIQGQSLKSEINRKWHF